MPIFQLQISAEEWTGEKLNLAGIREGDILCCDVRGDRFYALVRGRASEGRVPISSLISRPIPALRVTARQVIGHWRRSKTSQI
ncbi:MAG: hypothetical protein WB507_12735 [Solirubrobacterales bacterium]